MARSEPYPLSLIKPHEPPAVGKGYGNIMNTDEETRKEKQQQHRNGMDVRAAQGALQRKQKAARALAIQTMQRAARTAKLAKTGARQARASRRSIVQCVPRCSRTACRASFTLRVRGTANAFTKGGHN